MTSNNNNNNEDHDLTIRIETELETTSENFDRLHDTIHQSFLDESILPLTQPPQFNTSSSHLDSASNSSHYLKTLHKSNTTATNITPGAGGLKVPNPSISISQFPSILKTQTSPFNFSKLNFSRTSDPRSGGKALSLEEKLRIWRHDAIHQNLLLTAEFWGDKLVQLTNNFEDVYWLSHIKYMMGDYHVAIQLLSKRNLLGESLACRFLGAQCLLKLEKYWEALELLGKENPFLDSSVQVKVTDNEDGIKLEASMCWLRGEVYNKLNHRDSAKKSWLEALKVDYKCYEAYFSLVKNGLLSGEDEQSILTEEFYDLPYLKANSSSIITRQKSRLINEDLNQQGQAKEFEFVKTLYSVKQFKPGQQDDDFDLLVKEYKLNCELDKLIRHIDNTYLSGNYEDCLDETKEALVNYPNAEELTKYHILCLLQLEDDGKLFALGSSLQNSQPNFYLTYFALGCYHFVLKQYPLARQYLEKCVELYPTFEPALLGIGHTHILEGEYDASISSYAKTAKLLPYSHLPTMFLALRYSDLSNNKLAYSYFKFSLRLMKSPDPYFLNEFAAFCIKTQSYQISVKFILLALNHSPVSPKGYKLSTLRESLLYNLAQSYWLLKDFGNCELIYKQLRMENSCNYRGYLGLALLAYKNQKFDKCIDLLHNASALTNANHPEIQIVMDMAMKTWSKLPFNFNFGVWKDVAPSRQREGSPLEMAQAKKSRLL